MKTLAQFQYVRFLGQNADKAIWQILNIVPGSLNISECYFGIPEVLIESVAPQLPVELILKWCTLRETESLFQSIMAKKWEDMVIFSLTPEFRSKRSVIPYPVMFNYTADTPGITIGIDLYISDASSIRVAIESETDDENQHLMNNVDRKKLARCLLRHLQEGNIDSVVLYQMKFRNVISVFLSDFLPKYLNVNLQYRFNGVDRLSVDSLIRKLKGFSYSTFVDGFYAQSVRNQRLSEDFLASDMKWLADVTHNIPLEINSNEVCISFHNTMLSTEGDWYRQALIELGVKAEAITLL